MNERRRVLSAVGLVSLLAACDGGAPPFVDAPPEHQDPVPDAAPPPPFEVSAHTELDLGRLALVTNLPARVEACRGILDAPCDDADADGLTDAWEDLVLDAYRPIQRFDEEEDLFADPASVVSLIGRVAPTLSGARVFIVLGYARDYGRCGYGGHNGDSERIALDLVFTSDDAAGVRMNAAYTAAHENTPTDKSEWFVGDDLLDLDLVEDADGALRWRVYPSRGKHGTYATLDLCHDGTDVECVAEECGPDGVAEPAAFDLIAPVWNAGEELAPRLTSLAPLGFPDEEAWEDRKFCGGRDRINICSSAIRKKLLDDPFDD